MVTTSWWVLVSWQQVQRHCPACASMEYLQTHGPQDLPIYPDCPLLVSRGSGDSGQFPEPSGLLVLARTALWTAENPHLPQPGPSFPNQLLKLADHGRPLLWEPALGHPARSGPFLLPFLPGLTAGRGLGFCGVDSASSSALTVRLREGADSAQPRTRAELPVVALVL